MEILLNILLVVGILVGLLAIPLGLGGTFIVLGIGVLYDALHGFDVIGVPLLVTFLVLVILGEVQESILSSLVARRYGASRWGMFAAFAGGILGAILGSAVLPLIGTLIGSFLGAFILAFAVEWGVRSRQSDGQMAGFRAGLGAFIGRIASTAIKVAIGAAMAFVMLLRAF